MASAEDDADRISSAITKKAPKKAPSEMSASSCVDSIHFHSNGKRKMIRIFVSFENDRAPMDIPEGKKVSSVKTLVQDKFHIQGNRAQLGDENLEKNTLVLSYCGAELNENWVLSDMGVTPGSTIRAFIKEEVDPVFHLDVGYNEDTIPILDRIKIRQFAVADLRSMASRKTGLPVGIFRLTNKGCVEMFDGHNLDVYEIHPGDHIHVETWDGWTDFLHLAALGFTAHVMSKINQIQDETLMRFHMKVAMYMAAHFGHVELAVTLSKQGVRSDEPVGEHPLKQWCQLNRHIDLRKAPIHEAVEAGQLSVLRTFVHQNVCSIMARDGMGLQPLNIALRQQQKSCASFLLTKQWSRISYTSFSIPLAIFSRMKLWAERSRDKVILLHGQVKSSMKRKPTREYPLVGQGVYVEGFSEEQINSKKKSPSQSLKQSAKWAVDEYYRSIFSQDPEEHFRMVANSSMRLPKLQAKWGRTVTGAELSTRVSSRHGKATFDEEISSESDAAAGNNPKTVKGGKNLPPIQERNKQKQVAATATGGRRTQTEDDGLSRPSSSKSMYADPSKPASADDSKKKKKKNASASLLAQAKATDGSIPLPLNTVQDTPRPFFHVQPGGRNLAKDTLRSFEEHRGMRSRDYAIRCLSIANSFKEKPWLHQVRLAMSFTQQGVKKSVHSKDRNPSMFAAVET